MDTQYIPSMVEHPASSGGYKPPSVSSMKDVISEIHGAFSGSEVDVDHVTEILEAYKSNPADWKKFAKFDRYK